MAKTLSSQCSVPGFHAWSRNLIPHAANKSSHSTTRTHRSQINKIDEQKFLKMNFRNSWKSSWLGFSIFRPSGPGSIPDQGSKKHNVSLDLAASLSYDSVRLELGQAEMSKWPGQHPYYLCHYHFVFCCIMLLHMLIFYCFSGRSVLGLLRDLHCSGSSGSHKTWCFSPGLDPRGQPQLSLSISPLGLCVQQEHKSPLLAKNPTPSSSRSEGCSSSHFFQVAFFPFISPLPF